ncbi:demethylmenaquinone methyltransferase [Heliophilum fasciatum]|uniref:Demethylmenaquinone methyltransferase n=1 Tax=Heliophilum fasciatum TaxID=35700 RepID=A0A4V2SWT1_9FIRM|nr:demethylmenaquinone methyltransferase [Heliophilum fasciatum]MCW2278456.1 demethylmenaquinone methyltransferase/2-methoxy-6-polyprenyl-1,4-benzoquinol methylase [Heliophilum fasciatum]TCP63586.1 demethylmenaquinone methyltransferase/2-methoxy-6-polyprenyl-1,4-benzoquinol methylase [Heliophilum fasciatum]
MGAIGNFRSAEEKERFIQATFSTIATRYDRMNQVMTFNLDRRWRRKTVQLSGVPVGGEALDVCCGTGELSQALAKHVGGKGRVIGLDFNAQMLAMAREKQEKGRLARQIQFIQGNAMALPFEDNCFDTATIGFALRNVPDYRQALREMLRVVRPGGTIVSLETAKPEVPVLKELHGFYVNGVVPMIDKLSVGQQGPYAWLARSAQAFLPQKDLARVFTELGCQQVSYHNLLGGVVAVHVGVKA